MRTVHPDGVAARSRASASGVIAQRACCARRSTAITRAMLFDLDAEHLRVLEETRHDHIELLGRTTDLRLEEHVRLVLVGGDRYHVDARVADLLLERRPVR